VAHFRAIRDSHHRIIAGAALRLDALMFARDCPRRSGTRRDARDVVMSTMSSRVSFSTVLFIGDIIRCDCTFVDLAESDPPWGRFSGASGREI